MLAGTHVHLPQSTVPGMPHAATGWPRSVRLVPSIGKALVKASQVLAGTHRMHKPQSTRPGRPQSAKGRPRVPSVPLFANAWVKARARSMNLDMARRR